MEALFYIFNPIVTIIIVFLISLVVVAIFPKKIWSGKKWGWRLLMLELFVLIFISWVHTRPKEYTKNYLKTGNVSSLSALVKPGNPDVYIGTAFTNTTISQKIVKRYFNSITPDNPLKWGRTVNNENIYDYDYSKADAMVDYALENNLRIRGHVLVWGRAVDFFKNPDLRKILNNVPESGMPDTLQYMIKNYITTTLNRYRGKIMNWDCLNEPLNVFDGGFDNNIYYEYLGEDYIAQSFKWAHEVDPNVELYLNEQFNQYDSDKAISFLMLLRKLVDNKVPIHGVGIQAHAMFVIPEIDPLKKFLKEISDMGLKIEITELDARLRLFDGYQDPYQAQGEFYEAFVTACLENPAVQGITFWGAADNEDWYDSMPIFQLHQPNESLLFDKELHPKPAYFGVLNAIKKSNKIVDN
jgi:endo-1,4-beta-xylanase